MGDKYLIKAMKKQVILPDDLITEEILTRLPVKSIVRFKSVSKQWYSTLSSSDFANAHLIKSPFPQPSDPVNTLFIMNCNNCYLFSYDEDDGQIAGNFDDNLFKLDVDFGVEDCLKLAGCCNGLICLTPFSVEYFILWNPATRELHKFRSGGCSKFGLFPFVAHGFGFGYASSVDDYKFVRIRMEFEDVITNIVHVFSCRENKWRQINFGHEFLSFKGRAVLISEKLYWHAGNLVISFDLGVERFDIINFDVGCFDCIGVMGGALIKCNTGRINQGDNLIHILESPSSPTTVKSIGFPKELKLNVFSEVIGFTKTGKFFVTAPVDDDVDDVRMHRTLGNRGAVGLVDTGTKPMLYVTLFTFNHSIAIARYIPSLVSPFPSQELLDA